MPRKHWRLVVFRSYHKHPEADLSPEIFVADSVSTNDSIGSRQFIDRFRDSFGAKELEGRLPKVPPSFESVQCAGSKAEGRLLLWRLGLRLHEENYRGSPPRFVEPLLRRVREANGLLDAMCPISENCAHGVIGKN